MNPIYSQIYLDLQHKAIESVNLKQYDYESRYIRFHITDNGNPYILTSDIQATIKIHKPDGTKVVNTAAIDVVNNEITAAVTNQMTSVYGVLYADLTLFQNNQVISTMPFHLHVEKSPVQNTDAISTNEYGVLENLISDVQKNEAVRLSNEQSRISEEAIRTNNENQRIENEAIREANETARGTAENIRTANEQSRVSNESVRQEQENLRQEQVSTAVANAEKAAQDTVSATTDLQNKLDSHHFVLTEDKDITNGVAGLDANAKVPVTELYDATTSEKGITQLTDSITSTSVTTAATPNSVKTVYDASKTYTDTRIADLINGAPTTLDTLGEIADAMAENKTVVDALNDAIGTKIDTVTGDPYIKTSKSGTIVTITHEDVARTNSTSTTSPAHGGTFTAVKSVSSDSKGHVTAVDTETVTLPVYGAATCSAAGLESAADKAKLDGIETGAEVNQNAFSKVVVGDTSIAAGSKTDSLTLSGENVTITPDVVNNALTIGITKDNVTSALGYTPGTSIDTNTTYSLSKSGQKIILTGSDGSTTEINIAPENIGALSGMAATWLPSNGYNPLEHFEETAVQIYSVNPNLMISQGCPTGLSEYASIICFGVSAYVAILYIDVFGKFAIWNSKQNKWQGISYEGHIHDDRYYIKSEIDSKLSGKAGMSHTHDYLPLSGGTVTDTIVSSKETHTYLYGNQGNAIINSTAPAGGFTMLAKLNSKNGYFMHGVYETAYYLYYTTKQIVGEGHNGIATSVMLLDENGNSRFPGTVSASIFEGSLKGNADTASSVDWVNIKNKPSTFTPASHTHNYLPLNGGLLTGNLKINDGLSIGWAGGAYLQSRHGQELFIAASNEADYRLFFGVESSAWTLCPRVDGNLLLGLPGKKWGQIYSTVSAISTSDRNQKKDIHSLSEKYTALFTLLQPVSYRFIDGTSGRIHIGFISQDVEEAMEQVGLSDLEFAGFCKDKKQKEVKTQRIGYQKDADGNPVTDDNGDPIEEEYEDITYEDELDEDGNPVYIYSLRYEEFIALNTAVIQNQQQQIQLLEERLEKLEEKVELLSAD